MRYSKKNNKLTGTVHNFFSLANNAKMKILKSTANVQMSAQITLNASRLGGKGYTTWPRLISRSCIWVFFFCVWEMMGGWVEITAFCLFIKPKRSIPLSKWLDRLAGGDNGWLRPLDVCLLLWHFGALFCISIFGTISDYGWVRPLLLFKLVDFYLSRGFRQVRDIYLSDVHTRDNIAKEW